MDQHARTGKHPLPALVQQQHQVVEIYPRAGVLSAWTNAAISGAQLQLPAANGNWNPADVVTNSAGFMGLPVRCTLAELLPELLPHATRAQLALTSPGDHSGIPADVPQAARHGQACLFVLRHGSVVLWPTVINPHHVPARTLWQLAVSDKQLPPPVRLSEAERMVAQALVLTANQIRQPVADVQVAAEVRAAWQQLPPPPLPPQNPRAHRVADQAARLLLAVEVLSNHQSFADAALRPELLELGVAGRRALVSAMSHLSRSPAYG